MTDPDGILQLGIEAARDGNKEEARNLFRLLTNEDPQNAQGWLWLAGVAETPAERRAALEQVIELDPENAMARKSLNVMMQESAAEPAAPDRETLDSPEPLQFDPDKDVPGMLDFDFDEAASSNIAPPDTPDEFPSLEPTRPDHPPPPPADDSSLEDPFGENDPFAELDSLSDVFSDSPDAVGRSRVPLSEESDEPGTPHDHHPLQEGDEHQKPNTKPDQKKRVPSPPRPRLSGMASARAGGGDELKGSKKQMSRKPLLIGALGILGVVLIIFLVWQFVWPMFFGEEEIAGGPPPTQEQPASPPPDEQPAEGGEEAPPAQPPQEGGEPGDQPAPADGGEETSDQPTEPTPEATATPETPRPAEPAESESGDTPFAPPPPGGEGTAANPSIIPPNTPIESNGWLYDFNQNLCPGSCAVDFIGPVAGIQPEGRFIQVLVATVNRTGTEQPLPNNFLVLKDAQGRVYETHPAVSEAFVIPGVNADRSLEDPIPANGLATSVALFFDVAPDATDLVLYAPGRPDQGWLVLQSLR